MKRIISNSFKKTRPAMAQEKKPLYQATSKTSGAI
jgi:hypothetical protein